MLHLLFCKNAKLPGRIRMCLTNPEEKGIIGEENDPKKILKGERYVNYKADNHGRYARV